MYVFQTPQGRQSVIFFISLFAIMGAYLPFWPLYLAEWGLDAEAVGYLGSIAIFVRIGAGLFIPVLADRYQVRRLTIFVSCVLGALASLAFYLSETEASLLVMTILMTIALTPIFPLGEALGISAAKTYGFQYANARGIGSFAFLVVNIAVGFFIDRFNAGFLPSYVALNLILTAALVHNHPGGHIRLKGRGPHFKDIGRLFLNPIFLLFALSVSFVNGSHVVYYIYSALHWKTLGLSGGVIGALWAFAVLAEVVLMMSFGPKLVEKIGPGRAILIGGLTSLIRWVLMSFDPMGPLLWVLQALHMLSFAVMHLGAMAFIGNALPDKYGGTAQAMIGAVLTGAIMAISGMVCALFYESWGGATYLISAALALIGIIFSWVFLRKWNGEILEI